MLHLTDTHVTVIRLIVGGFLAALVFGAFGNHVGLALRIDTVAVLLVLLHAQWMAPD